MSARVLRTLLCCALLALPLSVRGEVVAMVDGDWTDPGIWFEPDGNGGFVAANRVPSGPAGGDLGEQIVIMADVNVPSGVDLVVSDTIGIFNGAPVENNFFRIEGGSTLTVQSGARVGSELILTTGGSGTGTIEVFGEFVSGGIDNANGFDLDVNVRPGGFTRSMRSARHFRRPARPSGTCRSTAARSTS